MSCPFKGHLLAIALGLIETVPMDYTTEMLTVAETTLYIQKSELLLSAAERDEGITFLSRSPKTGLLVRGAGGIRKVRWGKGSQGKSSGVRVIY